jgi:hypothetical protein
MRVIPEAFGGGALPRKELKDVASELTSDGAGPVARTPSCGAFARNL